MRLVHDRIREAREAFTPPLARAELARRLAKRDRELFWTTSAQQIKRWECGQSMRREGEVMAAIAAELHRPIEFFYDNGAADAEEAEESEEAAPVFLTVDDMRIDLNELIAFAKASREKVA